MYNEILLNQQQELPLVIRRKLLDFSSVQDDIIGAHSKLRNIQNYNNHNTTPSPSPQRRKNQSPSSSPYIHEKQNSNNNNSHNGDSSPQVLYRKNLLHTNDDDEDDEQNFLAGLQASDFLPRDNNNNRREKDSLRANPSVTDSLTSMWDRELASVKNNFGGGASLAVIPHWMESLNPKLESTTSVKTSLSACMSMNNNLMNTANRNIDQMRSNRNGKKYNQNLFAFAAGQENNNMNNNLLSSNNNNDNVVTSVLSGLLNFPAPPCQLTLHQDFDFNRIIQAHQQNRNLAAAVYGNGKNPTSSSSLTNNASMKTRKNSWEQDLFEKRENLSKIIMNNQVPIYPDDHYPSNNSDDGKNPFSLQNLTTFISDRDPRSILSRNFLPDSSSSSQKENHDNNNINNDYQLRPTKDPLYRAFEECSSIMANFLCNNNNNSNNNENNNNTTSDASSGLSTWLVGSKDPFLEPITLSRKLLDRICSSIHVLLLHRIRQLQQQQQDENDNNNNNSPRSRKSSTKNQNLSPILLPLALIGPARLIVPVSFTTTTTTSKNENNNSNYSTKTQETKLMEFFSKCLFLGRNRKPLFGSDSLTNQEILFQMYALGGIFGTHPLSGKSYHKTVSNNSISEKDNNNNSNPFNSASFFSSNFGSSGSSPTSSSFYHSSTSASKNISNNNNNISSRSSSVNSSKSGGSSAASSVDDDGVASSRGGSDIGENDTDYNDDDRKSSSHQSSRRGSDTQSLTQNYSSSASSNMFLSSHQNKVDGNNGNGKSTKSNNNNNNNNNSTRKEKERMRTNRNFEKNSKTINPFSGTCGAHHISSSSSFGTQQIAPPPMHFCFPSAAAISDVFEAIDSTFLTASSSSSALPNNNIQKTTSEAASICLSFLAATHSTIARIAGIRLPSLTSSSSLPSSTSNNSSSSSLPWKQQQTFPTSLEAAHRSLLVCKNILSVLSIGSRSRMGTADQSVPLILRCEVAVERRRVFLGGYGVGDVENVMTDMSNNKDDDDEGETEKIFGVSVRWVPESVDIRAILKKIADERQPTLMPEHHIQIAKGEVPTLAKKPLKPLAMKLVHCQTVIAGTSLHNMFDFEEIFGNNNHNPKNDSESENNINETSRGNSSNNNDEADEEIERNHRNATAAASCGVSSDYEDIVTSAIMNILHLAADLELASEEAKNWRSSQREILLPSTSNNNHNNQRNTNSGNNNNNKFTVAFCEATRRSIVNSVQRGLSLDEETTRLFVAHLLDDRLTLIALRARLRSFAADVMWSLLLWLFDASSVWVPSCGPLFEGKRSTHTKNSSSAAKAMLHKAVIRFVGSGHRGDGEEEKKQNEKSENRESSAAKNAEKTQERRLFGAGILDQKFEDEDTESNLDSKYVLSEHDLGGIGTKDVDFENIRDREKENGSNGDHEDDEHDIQVVDFYDDRHHQNDAPSLKNANSFGPYFTSVSSFGNDAIGKNKNLGSQTKIKNNLDNGNPESFSTSTFIENLKKELLGRFDGATSTNCRNLLPGLYSMHPLYSKMLRLPPHSTAARVIHLQQFASVISSSKQPNGSESVKNALSGNSNSSKLIDESARRESQLLSGGSWNMWNPDTRERLLISNTTTAATTFNRSPRGRMLLNSDYVSVFEKQTWKDISSGGSCGGGLTNTASDGIPPPAVLFFISKSSIAERAVDTQMTLTSSLVREEKAKMAMLPLNNNNNNSNGFSKKSTTGSKSFSQELRDIFGYPSSSSDTSVSTSVIPIDHNRDEQLRAIQFLWRNVVGLRGSCQKFFTGSTFLAQFWIIVLHHNWERSRSRTSTLLLDRLYALSSPNGRTLKSGIYTFHKRNPSVAIQWIANILALTFAEIEASGSPSYAECRGIADVVVAVGATEPSNYDDERDAEAKQFPIAKLPVSSVFVNGFDTFATLGFARRRALNESCIPIISRFVLAASALTKRWKIQKSRFINSAKTIQSFSRILTSSQFVLDLLRRRFIEARSHEIVLSGALEDRRQHSINRHRNVLMNSVQRQRSMLVNDLGISPYLTPPKSRRDHALERSSLLLNSPELEVEEIMNGHDGDDYKNNNGGVPLSPEQRRKLAASRRRRANTQPPPVIISPRHLRPSLLQLADAAQFETPLNPKLRQHLRDHNNNNIDDDSDDNNNHPRSSSSPSVSSTNNMKARLATKISGLNTNNKDNIQALSQSLLPSYSASGKVSQFHDPTHSDILLLGSSVAANSLVSGRLPSTVDRSYLRAISRSIATIETVELIERQRIVERQLVDWTRMDEVWSDMSPSLRHAKAERNSRIAVEEKWIAEFCHIVEMGMEPVYRSFIERSEAVRYRYLKVFNHNVGQKVIQQQEERARRAIEIQEARVALFLKNHSIMYTIMEQLQDQLNMNGQRRERFEREVATAVQMKASSLLSGGDWGSGGSSSHSPGGRQSSSGGVGSGSGIVGRASGNSRIANVVKQAVLSEREPLHVRLQRGAYLSEADCLRSILEFTPNVLQAEEIAREHLMHTMERETILTRESSIRAKLERNCMSFLVRFGLEFQLFLLPLVERELRAPISALGALCYSDMGKRFVTQRAEQHQWEQLLASQVHEKKEIDREAQMWDTLFDDSYASPMKLLEALERDRHAVKNLMNRVGPLARDQQVAGRSDPRLFPQHHLNFNNNNGGNPTTDYYANLVSAVAAARRKQQQQQQQDQNNLHPSTSRSRSRGNNTSYQSYFQQAAADRQNQNEKLLSSSSSSSKRMTKNGNTFNQNDNQQDEVDEPDDRIIVLSGRRYHDSNFQGVSQNNNRNQNPIKGTTASSSSPSRRKNNGEAFDIDNNNNMSPNSKILRDAGATARPSRTISSGNNTVNYGDFYRQQQQRGNNNINVNNRPQTPSKLLPLTTERKLLDELKGRKMHGK